MHFVAIKMDRLRGARGETVHKPREIAEKENGNAKS
jgi:hypothetical protein